ncbi:aquaporin-9-like [Oppia nitens]|uniref:aquaporin-9-like n=1 Tax=Oppia nitens TaxID=1686743 RepID=UPI0023DAB5CC|nr:aquaporin-9-like [Oppia nitens]
MNKQLKEFFAECLGTLIIITLGCGAVASNVLKGSSDISIGLGFGLGVFIGAAIAIPISGAHLNPAVTIALCFIKKCKWNKVVYYLPAQYIGAFLGAAIVYGIYGQGIQEYENEFMKLAENTNTTFDKISLTAGIYATYPQSYLTITQVFADQIFSCAILMIAILAITDEKGINTPRALQPLSIALVVCVLIISYGLNCGATLNPARDLAPRVFTALAGYGLDVFKPLEGQYWWSAGLVAPHIGAIVGGLIYVLGVGVYSNNCDDSNASLSTVVTVPVTKNDVIFQRARQVISENMKVSPLDRERDIHRNY